MLESLFNKYAGLKACNFIQKRFQHRCFPVKFEKFLRTLFFTEHIRWLLLKVSHKLSLYCIWGQWMVSFRGTYLLSSAYFILLDVFRFFLFPSFFLIFLWILLVYGFEVSLSILKIKQCSCSKVPKCGFERWVASALFSNYFNWLGSVLERLKLHLTSTCLLELLAAEYLSETINFYISLKVTWALDALKKSSKKKETIIKSK